MSIITLTTDLGTKDHYVSSVKASIIRQLSTLLMSHIRLNHLTFQKLPTS